MLWILAAISLFGASGIPGLFLSKKRTFDAVFSTVLIAAGGIAGLVGLSLNALQIGSGTIDLPWNVPHGAFHMSLDAVSAVFLFPVFLVVPLGAVYGLGYFSGDARPPAVRRFRLFYGLIGASTVTILTAQNSILFLISWEIMAISGFFLVAAEDHHEEARSAGLLYLVATHTGTLALIAMFVLLSNDTGSFEIPAAGSLVSSSGAAIFILGLVGFGLKAGIMPLHIWLPDAHCAAPSHASALLSGLVIKLGIYGLIRITSLYAHVPAWFGWTIFAAGIVSSILGVAFAIAQHDIKRLLAYHSVENIGIIAMGIGLALLGRAHNLPLLVLLGISGALLHVVNHGLFKSLLFFSAGSVISATGTRNIDSLGALLRKQPWTAAFFLVGAVAISGLPPFNGFVSEWLIYMASISTIGAASPVIPVGILAAPALALTGGLALACFVKVFGIAFLGEARSEASATARECKISMRAAMAPLAMACLYIGIMPVTLMPFLEQAAYRFSPDISGTGLNTTLSPLFTISIFSLVLIAALGAVTLWLFLKNRTASHNVSTWGCGYAQPTSRMQYTASSFADGLVGLFRFGLMTKETENSSRSLFPPPGYFHSHTPDGVLDRVLFPLFHHATRTFVWIRARIQNGHTSFYLLCVILTVIVLLIVSL